jgi:hypothetical protein
LIARLSPGIVPCRGMRTMRRQAALALALALLGSGSGCAGGGKCPTPVRYDDATLKQIQKAREALPKDSVLHQVLIDYENERDDLRACR